MKSPCPSFHPAGRLNVFSALLASLFSGAEPAAAANAGGTAPEEDITVLSPFVVSSEQDTGYAATNTLDGSRLNTALRDTPAPISVFTRDFLDDIGATDLASMMRYDLSNEVEFGDFNAEGTGNQVGSFDTGTAWRTRGLQGGASVNGFRNSGADGDLYNIERAGSSRGPNAILFGTGAPGGVVNLRTKTADTNRRRGSLEFKIGNHDVRRSAFDYNHVLIDDKLALRVMGVYDRQGSHIPHVHTRKTGGTVALQYRPARETSLRLSYDQMRIEGVGGRPWGFSDSITRFLRAIESGEAVFDPVDGRYETAGGAVVGASLGAGNLGNRTVLAYGPDGAPVLWEGASATGNHTTLSSTASEHTGAKPNIPEWVAPYGSVNASGGAEYGRIDQSTFNVTFDHRWFENFYMELTYNRAKKEPDSMIASNPELRASLNPLDPYFLGNGYYFSQQNLVRLQRELTDETLRAAFSYKLDLDRFGDHRFALLGERHTDHGVRYRTLEVWLDAPYGGAPEAVNNRVNRRKYFKIDGPYSEWGIGYNPRRFASETFTSQFGSIGELVSGWAPANNLDIDDTVTTDSALLVMQNFFFNRRLVTTFGLRHDDINIFAPNTLRDAGTQAWRFATEADQSTFAATGRNWYDEVDLSGSRRTVGAVFHVTDNLSLTANSSDGVQLPDRNRSVLPNERPADPYPGESVDYGVTFSLLDNKLSGSLRYYESAMRREPSNALVGPVFVNPNNDIMSSFDHYYRQAGLANLGSGAPIADIDDLETIYVSQANAYLADTESEGWEFEMTANPTRQWTFRLGYARTDASRTNVLSEGEQWWAERLQLWQDLDAYYTAQTGLPSILDQTLIDRNDAVTDRTVRERIGDSATELAAIRIVEEHGYGIRRDKVNLWTRYTFNEGGPLGGAAIGGGYRYQSANLAGFDIDNNRPLYGNPRSLFDLFLQYRAKGFFGRGADKASFVYQLNVNNLFDDDTIIVSKRLVDTATGEVYDRRAFREQPRSVSFTVRMYF